MLARGPKSVGALRRRGIRELWSPGSECFEDVLAHLRGRDLRGRRIVVQEHGSRCRWSPTRCQRQGARVEVVTVYRVQSAEDPEPMFRMVDLIADRELDAVTFTSAPAVAALMEAAGVTGRRDEVIAAFQADVVAACVGPVTAAAFEMWGVPTHHARAVAAGGDDQAARDRAAVAQGRALARGRRPHPAPARRPGAASTGCEVHLSPAPLAVLHALVVNPGHVVSRAELLAALPSGTAGSEHAVEMAVARLRAALGTRVVQTVVKRGYRLAVGS